jgi:hypothetical protein
MGMVPNHTCWSTVAESLSAVFCGVAVEAISQICPQPDRPL